MTGLPASGTMRYNGVDLSDGTTKIEVNVEFVEDDAKRTVVYHRHTITVQVTVCANPTDAGMLNLRKKLSLAGGELIFRNKGFGADLWVNGYGQTRDVKNGPHPEILSWTPIGHDQAAEVVWKVVVCVPVCDNARLTGIMALNYGLTFSISEKGFTTRTIAGYLEIAASRQNANANRQISDTADAYFDRIAPEKPEGYHREWTRRLSLDKTRLDFDIVDKQIESKFAYPPGIIHAEGKHRINWNRNRRGSQQLRGNISVTFESGANVSQQHQWWWFGQIVQSRTAGIYRKLLDDVTAEEDIWGYGSSFSVGYRILHPLSDLISVGNLWKPIGTTWANWEASLTEAHRQTGYSGLVHSPTHDAIVDLCGPEIPLNFTQPTPNYGENSIQAATWCQQIPPPDKSWLDYEMKIVPLEHRGVTIQTPLQKPDGNFGDYDPQRQEFRFDTGGLPENYPTTVVEHGATNYVFFLEGYAKRAGYPIPRPSLQSACGMKGVYKWGYFNQRQVGKQWCVPIYEARWCMAFHLDSLANPVVLIPQTLDPGQS